MYVDIYFYVYLTVSTLSSRLRGPAMIPIAGHTLLYMLKAAGQRRQGAVLSNKTQS